MTTIEESTNISQLSKTKLMGSLQALGKKKSSAHGKKFVGSAF